jgi:hypothetical protein
MAYGTVAGASALVPAQTISTLTAPSTAQVTTWCAEADAIINRTIAGAGYTVPVSAGTTLYTELVGLSNLYAAAYILRAVGIDTSSGNQEDRSEVWLEDFRTRLHSLAASNLAALGATALPASSNRRRRVRTLQLRRIDGYSARHEGAAVEPLYPSE